MPESRRRKDSVKDTSSGSSKTSPSNLAARIANAPRLHDNDHPLWEGPCGQGPNGGITQSMLVRFLSCRERFRLRYVCGLEPYDKWNHRLGYGNMWHVCEEALAKGRHHFDALAAHSEEMLQRYPFQREEITKWHNVCCVQFPEYVQHWDNHPDVTNRKPLFQEKVFDVPYTLPSGSTVRLRGKWDSVDLIEPGPCNCGADRTGPSAEAHREDCPAKGPWTFKDGRLHGVVYLQENKTKGDVDRAQIERQLTFDLQTMMYLVALDRFIKTKVDHLIVGGYPFPIKGVRYNVIRRPLSGGKGNITRHKARGGKPAETETAFYERLRRDYIAADSDHWFFRVRAEISERDSQVFRDTCLDPLLENLCCWYECLCSNRIQDPTRCVRVPVIAAALHYRTPFGVYSALEEGGSTEYDAYLDTGSEAGLRRVEKLFTELGE